MVREAVWRRESCTVGDLVTFVWWGGLANWVNFVGFEMEIGCYASEMLGLFGELSEF